MFAVVNIAGQQFNVQENTKYYVPRLKAEVNSEVVFNEVFLLSKDNETKVGSPYLKDVTVTAKVIEHLKDEKVVVFKKKRVISYKKKVGHRQPLSQIEVLKIG